MASFHNLDNAAAHHFGGICLVNPFAAVRHHAFSHFATFRLKQIGNGFQSGRFARSVSAQKCSDTAFGDTQGYALKNQNNVVIDHLDIVHFEQCFLVL